MVARKRVKNEIAAGKNHANGPSDAGYQQAKARKGHDSESQNGRNHTQHQSPANQSGRLLHVFAVVSALAAIGSAVFAGVSNFITWQSVNDARIRAHVELRSYISVTGKVTNIHSGGPINVRLTVRNAGRTPADNLLVHFQVVGDENQSMESNKQPPPCPCGNGADARFTLADIPTNLPADGIAIVDHSLPGSVRNDLLNGKYPIRASGCITYSDVFNEQHQDYFRLIQGGQYDPHADAMGQDYNEPIQFHKDN